MSPSVTCYPKPGKEKSARLLKAFAAGAPPPARVLEIPPVPHALYPGAAAFYDVRGLEHLWWEAGHGGRDRYYLDNAFFDCVRERMFRVSRNGLQRIRHWRPDMARMRRLGISVAPWRRSGGHVLICAQSEWFLRFVGEDGWQARTLEVVRQFTDRELRLRDKRTGIALAADLRDCWAVVTHMSAAANEALLAGVPVFVTGECAARQMGRNALQHIEQPFYPDDREEWAGALAGAQWTEQELAKGAAWQYWNEEGGADAGGNA